EQVLAAGVPLMQQAPMAAGQMLLALDLYLGPGSEFVLVGDMAHADMKAAIAAVHPRHFPRSGFPVLDKPAADAPGSQSRHLNEIFEGKESPNGQPVLYVCQNFACGKPATGLAQIEIKLEQLVRGKPA